MPGGEGASVTVLRDIDLTVEAGEFLALQGTSGSGKSTLLSIIGLLDRPSAGRYLLNGRDVSHLSDDELSDLRNSVLGFVFQSFHLIPYATALENVLLPGMYSHAPQGRLRKRAHELLERVGLGDRAGFRPGRLSGGQQQRVAMARALLNDPDLLLADEPTGQLDSATSSGIMDLFREINATGKTVILVTHDDEVAAAARRVVRLHDGRASEDPPAGAGA
ncbi:ABC transporter ATP-binding protein [Desulfovibrio aminophilus]|nr:ABC transporter ATP-binding protein [Desulfovibrio aminophilus]MCM0754631.1 ABC transporter ATP-binding protein [Desulfovibrio aminophilus]